MEAGSNSTHHVCASLWWLHLQKIPCYLSSHIKYVTPFFCKDASYFLVATCMYTQNVKCDRRRKRRMDRHDCTSHVRSMCMYEYVYFDSHVSAAAQIYLYLPVCCTKYASRRRKRKKHIKVCTVRKKSCSCYSERILLPCLRKPTTKIQLTCFANNSQPCLHISDLTHKYLSTSTSYYVHC